MALKYECYFLNVPFNKDYKHIVYFSSATQQFNSFTAKNDNDEYIYVKHHFTNLNVIVKNNAFIIKGRNKDFDNCNYLMYRASDDTKWFYAFIDDVVYNTFKGTYIYHTIDVWQSYHTSATFHSAFIERGHITSDEDNSNFFKYTMPEPFSFSKIISKDISTNPDTHINAFQEELEPYYVLHALGRLPSVVADDSPLVIAENKKVGGQFTHTCYGALTPQELTYMIDRYGNTIQTTPLLALPVIYRDARYALEGCDVVPKFTTDGQSHCTEIETTLDYYVPSAKSVFKNFSTGRTLACGYTPRNKKLYNSQFQVLSLNTYNGCHYEFDMSLFEEYKNSDNETITPLDEIQLQLYGSCGGCGDFYVVFPHYKSATRSEQAIRISYGGRLTLGYDESNSGEYRQQRQIQALSALAKTGVSLATGITAIKTATTGIELKGLGVGDLSNPVSLRRTELYGEMINNSVTTEQSAYLSSLGKGLETSKKFADQEASNSRILKVGNQTDLLDMSLGMYSMNVELNSIRKKEAEIIDDYFDRYGYSIFEYGNIKTYITHRSIWNYIKADECVIDLLAPEDDVVTFNRIFENGTTVWRGDNGYMSRVGIYGTDNV